MENYRSSLPTYEQWREKDPLLETQKILQEIDELMAKLAEQKDLDPQIQQALRASIQELMFSLGVKNAKEFIVFQRDFQTKVNRRRREPVFPNTYPSLDIFNGSHSRLLTEKPYFLPDVRDKISASEVAAYAQYDWRTVDGRGIDAVSYIYHQGKILCDELVYRESHKADDISIGRDWRVENGLHRSLALRVLGRGFVLRSGMDLWVTVQKDPDMI